MESNIIKGTPGPILLPAKRWCWKHVEGPVTIDVPSNVALVGEGGNKRRSIKLGHSDGIDVWLDFNVLTKTLFSSEAYPKLEGTQVFSISSVLLSEDKGLVTIVGNVLEKV